MKTSARNQFAGIVKTIKQSGIYSEVVLTLPSRHEIVATITRESCENLGLVEGGAAIALIKSTSIIIATDLEHIKLSARNQLSGLIADVERGAVNSVVTLDLGDGMQMTAGVTLQSTEQLDLHPGQRATAIFKAGSVILGVLA
ncbi:TOBE domain-containing protein [Neisseria perflava]|uniref:TOBE domain-containing protein n=1 Tax=Neisseria perflava TaxID=33053 RepID=UPI00209CF3A3|nr:TOBE domain-containing protein [Neisseria perflava]MCP1660584.1 molybdate transport system regulatory protein [Neisseria perflava]MCP1772416.1 molybdate transport system regulatory protein [Neisseria perflava]